MIKMMILDIIRILGGIQVLGLVAGLIWVWAMAAGEILEKIQEFFNGS